jgi:uridine monophosphate synthetase
LESFFTLLLRRAEDTSSLLCVGLDPHPGDLPEPTAAAARAFCLRLVEATLPCAAAYKPNAAFFEMYGPEGWAVLREVIAAIRDASLAKGSRAPVILDAKRGDIASTAEAYAQSAFHSLGADCITLSPYLGKDSIDPFLADHEKGVFLLCKTSNPGASDIQDLAVTEDGRRETGAVSGLPSPVYLHVARLAQMWNEKDNVGLVVGATQPEALARVRAAAPDLWFLAPGVGAQGGDLKAALRAGLRRDGLGMLIPVSRAISRADDPRRAAAELRDKINQLKIENRNSKIVTNLKSPSSNLADALLEIGCVKFGAFTLKSGQVSPIYIDLRRLVADPRVLALTAEAFLPLLQNLPFDHLAALPYAALPIGTAVSLRGGYPLIYPRKEAKAYGTKADIEGVYQPGERAVVLDDLITTGGSKFEGIDKLTGAGLIVEDVVVLIDRSTGAAQGELAARGVRLHAVFTLAELLDYWERTGQVEAGKIAAARAFLAK